MQCTAVFYTAISRLRFISKHTSVSTDQNWATVLQRMNQISLGSFILIETLTYLPKNMVTCKHIGSLLRLTPTPCLSFE